MKEHNYTIPLTEALEAEVSCFLCKIEDELSERALAYYMGAAVMEPAVRMETNEKGFCRYHGEKMLEMPKKLPLVLALQTRLSEIQKQVKKMKKPGKGHTPSCAVCDRTREQMEKCLENCLWLLKKEPDFLNKYLQSQGVCLHHFYALTEKMGKGDGDLYKVLHAHMEEKLQKLEGRVEAFARSFDYRSHAEENLGSVPRFAVETLTERKK